MFPSHYLQSNLTILFHSFPYPGDPAYSPLISTFWHFTHTTSNETFKLGYIINPVAEALRLLPPNLSQLVSLDAQSKTVSLVADTPDSRSEALSRILSHWREDRRFTVLTGWRGESYPIYAPPGLLYAGIERAGAPLFGIVAHCVYLIGYSFVGKEKELKLWIPRRSKTKQTYAGMLDVTVAGAMVVGEGARDCVSREAFEEASLSMEMVREQAKEVARVSYFGVSTGDPKHGGGERGLCLPEAGVVYEIILDEKVQLRPRDGEVEDFYCWSVSEVQEALQRGEFKGNSGAVMVDWLEDRGMLGLEKETGELVSVKMRRKLDFPHI